MKTNNRVFIATSLDGFIADKDGKIDWLHAIPNPNKIDMGYSDFMSKIDALVMGRTTFETVCGFEIDWPYHKPVFVLSHSLKEVPKELEGRVFLMKGALEQVLKYIYALGHENLYIDGGSTIQGFLKEDLIDDLVITTIPVLLGGGTRLFGELPDQLKFKCIRSVRYLDCIVQSHFVRQREE